MVMSTSASDGTPDPRSGPSRERLIDDILWHIDTMASYPLKVSTGNRASDGAPPITGEDRMRWHADAVKEDLKELTKKDPEQVTAAAPERRWKDRAWWRRNVFTAASITLFITVLGFIGAFLYTYTDNGGLQGRVNALQGQLTDIRNSYGQMTTMVVDQVDKGNISVQTVLSAMKGYIQLPSLRLTGQALYITSPSRPTGNNPAVVPYAITVTGIINKELQPGETIWILLSTPGIVAIQPG